MTTTTTEILGQQYSVELSTDTAIRRKMFVRCARTGPALGVGDLNEITLKLKKLYEYNTDVLSIRWTVVYCDYGV